MSNLIGQQIASYQIQTMAGEGAIGSVYQAIELGSESLVAVKLVHLKFEQRVRDVFLEQARQAQRLAHSSIVPYYEVTIMDGNVYLVSELLPLGSLAQRLVELRYRGEVLPLAVVLGMVLQLAEGLYAAHEMGVVHGHLSMENVLLADEQTVKISDFGLWLPSLTATDHAAWIYAAPEQLRGAQGDLLSDVYALGVLFYELVVGEPPFAPNSFEEAKQMHGEEEPEEPRNKVADLPSLINEIILHMLEKEPEDRPTNLLDVIQTIQFATADEPNDAVALVAGVHSAENGETQFDVTDGIDAALVEFNDQWGADEDRVTISRTPPIVHGLGDKDIVIIGRSPTCDITLDHPSISGRHASLRRISGGWEVRDLGSRNGAYINRTKLLADVAEIWENHQTLRLGPYYFRLQIVPRDIKQREVDLELGPTHAEVVLGQSTEVEVILLNHGERRDYLKLRVEGQEASWMTLGQDTVEIMPNERAIVMLKMRPPRLRDELVLQTHPYTLIATSLLRERDPIDGEGQVYVQASHSVHTALFPNSQVNTGTFKLNIRNDGALPLNCQIRSRQPDSTLIFGPWTAEGVVVSTESVALVGAGNLGERLNEQTQALTQHRIWRGFNRFPGVTQLLSRVRQLSFFRNIQHIEGNVDELRQQGRLAKEATETMTGRSQSAETTTPESPTPERGFGLERTRTQRVGVQQDTQARPFMEANLQIASHHEAELRLEVGGVRRPFFGRTSSHPFELELNTPGDAPRLHNATLRIEPRLPMWAFWLTLALLFTGLIAGLLFLQPVRVFGLLDTDEDKLRDSVELYAYQTDARSADSDNDGLPDGLEVAVGLNPLQSDSDNDGLLDGQERIDWRNGAPYQPLTPRQLRRFDADGDGKIDGIAALSPYPSSAFDTDSDRDSFADGLEINTCHDPLRPDQGPVMADRCKRSIPATVNNPPPIKAVAAVTETFAISASVGAETNATFVLGDNAENVRSTHLLTFDLSQLPRSVRLRDVQLIVTEPTRQGRPANLGLLTIDLMDGSTPQITRLAQLQPDGTSANWQATLTQLIDILPTRNTLTLRLATTLANNKDNRPDQLTFAAANSDSPPRLIVVYEQQGAESE